ncbi:hypothetical protein [Rhodosalinus sp.]|uniref:hypothetical protein n=1 Tax=Rhodosalinus sp. TaxID=2047741 RepID=UPI00397E2045
MSDILTTETEQGSPLDEEIASIARQLREMRHELEDFQHILARGDWDEAREAGKAVASVKQWIRLAIEAEMLLHARRRTGSGIARGGYALDLDAARAEIGARLDRLRRTGGPAPVPG